MDTCNHLRQTKGQAFFYFKFLPATFVLIILEKYLWREESLEVSEKEHGYRYFSWIWISTDPDKMIRLAIANIQVASLLQQCVKNVQIRSFSWSGFSCTLFTQSKNTIFSLFRNFVLYCYFMSLIPHKIVVFPVFMLQMISFEQIFSSFEKSRISGFF